MCLCRRGGRRNDRDGIAGKKTKKRISTAEPSSTGWRTQRANRRERDGGICGNHYSFLDMETVNHINARIKTRKAFNKKTLWKIRLGIAKEEKLIWFLLLVALVFPVIPFSKLGVGVPFLHPCRVILDNVSYGYIAGMIFYLFSDFRPKSYRIFEAKQQLASMYSSIHSNYAVAANVLGVIDNDGQLVDSSEAVARKSLLLKEIDDLHVAINEGVISTVKAMLNLVDKEIGDLLLLHNGDLEENEVKDINRFRNLFDTLKISNLYDFVSSHDIVVANNDLEYFLSSLILNYSISKRLKKQYSVYRFDAGKFDEETGFGGGFGIEKSLCEEPQGTVAES